ncbi:nuclear transport factor 2 family protein [Aeromicrobium sp. Leaf350]|uniref:nuclear transport factor 2 family protein n=1 Tax=Aeromicrobium sp. Leaf350 TaxID=2876565 RepID=UPI001E56A376|nr:nuclear transport factor 2 family protein [Aeromicrobium sp. Leaf350]
MDRIADRLELQDLVHAYAEGIDDGRAEDVAAIFAEDCVFRAFAGPKGEARGREAVAVLVGRLLATFRATSHHVSNMRVDFTGEDEATGRTSLYAWHAFTTDRPDGYLWGRYVDTFRREDGRWLIAERELRIAGQQDFDFAWIPRT